MDESNIRLSGKIFLAAAILLVFSLAGCGMFQKTAPPAPPPAKPEASEQPPSPKVAQETAPAVRPPPPPEQRPVPPEPAPEVKPAPPPASPAEATPDPVASGAVILNLSAPGDAKTIQARLEELGFYQGPVDGIWGKGSRAALRKFKVKNSLPNPEKWDRETQVALFAGERKARRPAMSASQDLLASGSVFLNPSNANDAQTIQGRLAEIGVYSGGIDGIWGKGSRAALKQFKVKNGLPNPERWDKETQMLLFKGSSQ